MAKNDVTGSQLTADVKAMMSWLAEACKTPVLLLFGHYYAGYCCGYYFDGISLNSPLRARQQAVLDRSVLYDRLSRLSDATNHNVSRNGFLGFLVG